MSNVTYVTDFKGGINESIPSPFSQESKLYFTAVEREMFWQRDPDGSLNVHLSGTYETVENHKVLLRSLNGQAVQLAVVGGGYHVVQNKELFQSIEEQFITTLTPDEIAGVEVHDRMSYNGRTCMRQYIFPNMRCKSPTHDDIAFRTIVKNGFGGSSIVLYSGAISFFCTNGMISGKYDCMYARHTKGMRITDITSRVRRSIDAFYKNAETWNQWHGRTITDEEAGSFLMDVYSERLAHKLYRQWLIECNSHGRNMWALYNVLTYYASHDEGDFATRETGVDHAAVTLLKREEQVQSAVASDTWTRLLAA